MSDPAVAEMPSVQAASTVSASASGQRADQAPGRYPSLLQRLLNQPARFSFDAAVAILLRASKEAAKQATGGAGRGIGAVRFQAPPGMGFVPADVLAVKPSAAGFSLTTGLLGLTGPAGALPRPYTEAVNAAQRRRSPALAAFLDLLAQRLLGAFANAAIKYRPHRAADVAAIGMAEPAEQPQDGLRDSLLALTGYKPEHLLDQLTLGADPLLFYAGAFAARPRSADRLAAMLSDWLGQPVEVEQFVGTWLELGRDQMTALPTTGQTGQFNQLGVDAAIGARAWDIQSRIILRIGPVGFDQFQALLPGRELLRRLASLTAAYLEGEVGFAINPVLAGDAVPQPSLGATAPCLLGWTGWLPVTKGRREDARDAVFDVRHDETNTGGP